MGEYSSYRRFKDWVYKLHVVNDCTEIALRLIQDYSKVCVDKVLKQDILLSIAENRAKHLVSIKTNLIIF